MPTIAHPPRSASLKPEGLVYFDLTDTADDRFDRIIEVMLVALLAFCPLALGAVQAWSEAVFVVIACAMAMCLAIKLVRRPEVRFVWSWTYLPIAFFLSLVAFQLLPLPADIVHAISPRTFNLRAELLSTLPSSGRHLQSMPLSMNPAATWQNLRLFLSITAIYVVTLNAIRQTRQIQRVLMAIVWIGTGIAIIALAHLAMRAERIYGFIGRLQSGWPIAPFINRNHLGQFLNLSLGAAFAVGLISLEHPHQKRNRYFLGAAFSFMSLAVVLSLSRGALLSMTISGLWVAVILYRNGMRKRIWSIMPFVWLAAIVGIWLAFDHVAARFAEDDSAGAHSISGRIQIVHDIVIACKQFPILGLGAGAFETAYPMFDGSKSAMLASHAENEYAQVLLECGTLGLAAVVGFLLIIVRKYFRCLRSMPSPMGRMAIGIGFGISSIVLQSATDFGQHLPANASLTAVMCALLVTLAEASQRIRRSNESIGSSGQRARRLIACVMIACASVVVISGAMTAAAAEEHWKIVRRAEPRMISRDWQAEDNEYAMLLMSAQAAAERQPGEIHYQYWLNYYRWKFISQQRDPATGKILVSPQQIEWAARIARELVDVARRCPTYGPVYLLAGQIETNILDQVEGRKLIRAGYRLSRNDPAANFEAGLLDAREGEWEAALQKLRHAADLSPPYLDEGIEVLFSEFRRTDLSLQLAGENVPAMQKLAKMLQQTNDPQADEMQRQVNALIRKLASAKDASAEALIDAARLASAENDYSIAIQHYRNALNLKFARADWRLELARTLATQGNVPEAMEQARIAERLGSGSAQAFMTELRLHPSSAPAFK